MSAFRAPSRRPRAALVRTSRRRPRFAFAAAAVLVAGSTALAGCAPASSSGSGGSNAGPITIGMSLPLTGPAADVAKAGYQGYELWASQVNASGGLLGRQVKLDVLDDGMDPNQTTTDYTRLISQDHVGLLLGTFSSLLNAPASAVAARNQMLYVEPSGGATSLFQRGFTDLFFAQPGTTASLPNQFLAWFSSLPADQRPKTAAYLTQDDPSASPAISVFVSKLQALGVTTVYNQTYDPSTSNFDSIAAAVVHAQPQMIIQGSVTDDGAQFARSLEKLNYSPKILFQTNSPTDATYPSAIGTTDTDGVFTAEAWSAAAKYPGNAAFVTAYSNKFGTAPTEDAANSYTAGQVLEAAVKAVGKLDQKALAAWLHTHSVDTIVGPLTWDSTGDPQGSLMLAQWQNGTLQVIDPQTAATTKTVVFPKPAWKS
ncbi:amino acid ABC transporter substrate-binding protein [Actinospica sp.]|jgi:branched-chain amino acid transport system substrate-binding protein|uniref:amino acid ABC transporter substrate-binding protein n=1 Tax=Actinospica sp. TaxID=1872142 RepID=UPI002BECE257|nr:amino acid ABC transporter substrate-binding protein [Actinospica sp.]HWG28650.1 amino acid ABC transporter substrate-binding protein [Actinospica sp.]